MRGHDLAQADPGALADVVDRPRREVAHARVPDVQVHEHVVRHPVPPVDSVEVEQPEILERDRGVARLRVGDVPVAGRDLRQQREHGVAEVARARDQVPGLAGEESVRLRVVDLAARDGLDERLEVRGVHLVVAGHHRRDVDPLVARALVAGDDRGADALVPLVADQLDARSRRGLRRPRRSRRSSGRRRRRSGRRSRERPRSSRRSASPRRGPGSRRRPTCARACV